MDVVYVNHSVQAADRKKGRRWDSWGVGVGGGGGCGRCVRMCDGRGGEGLQEGEVKGRGSSITRKKTTAPPSSCHRALLFQTEWQAGFQVTNGTAGYSRATVFGLGLTQSNQANDISLQSCWGGGGGEAFPLKRS